MKTATTVTMSRIEYELALQMLHEILDLDPLERTTHFSIAFAVNKVINILEQGEAMRAQP